MHVSDEAQILLVPRSLTYGHPPFFNLLQYSHLYAGRSYGRSLGKASHKLVEKLLGTDLKMKCISAILDAYIQKLPARQQLRRQVKLKWMQRTESASRATLGFRSLTKFTIAIAASRGLYAVSDPYARWYGRYYGKLSRIAFLRIYQVGYLKVEGKVGLEVLGIYSVLYRKSATKYVMGRRPARTNISLQGSPGRLPPGSKAIPCRIPRGGGFHNVDQSLRIDE